jgi:NAD(P)-dependent dehydrogenase (short-subunit alcohol dehydrogenase family)
MDGIDVAVVTGGGSGIGEALCRRLAADGTRVAVVDLDADRAATVAGQLSGAMAVPADVGDERQVEDLVARVERNLGPVDLYCSNAGISSGGGLGDDDDWSRAWTVHVMAHIYAGRAVLPRMAERGRGTMLLTASAAGLLAMVQSAPYTVTKHATVALAEWLAINWGDRGIRFACLCPQGVRTRMLAPSTAGEAEVAASGGILEPDAVAESVMTALAEGRFLVLPHPEVAGYEAGKVADRDRWLAGMRRLAGRVIPESQ